MMAVDEPVADPFESVCTCIAGCWGVAVPMMAAATGPGVPAVVGYAAATTPLELMLEGIMGMYGLIGSKKFVAIWETLLKKSPLQLMPAGPYSWFPFRLKLKLR